MDVTCYRIAKAPILKRCWGECWEKMIAAGIAGSSAGSLLLQTTCNSWSCNLTIYHTGIHTLLFPKIQKESSEVDPAVCNGRVSQGHTERAHPLVLYLKSAACE